MRGNKILAVFGVMAIGFLAGCASAPQISPAGGEVYLVSAAGTPLDSHASTNHRAFAAASAYCDSQGKALLFRQSQESGTHSLGPKREELTFTCINAADPSYLNAGLRREDSRSSDPMVARQ